MFSSCLGGNAISSTCSVWPTRSSTTGSIGPRSASGIQKALLDQEMLIAGLSILGGLIETTDDADDLAEACGLVGRANKQLYVLTGTSAGQRRHVYLQEAIDAYYEVYQGRAGAAMARHHTAALLKRAASDGVDAPDVWRLAVA